jgi:hypothetical protein
MSTPRRRTVRDTKLVDAAKSKIAGSIPTPCPTFHMSCDPITREWTGHQDGDPWTAKGTYDNVRYAIAHRTAKLTGDAPIVLDTWKPAP